MIPESTVIKERTGSGTLFLCILAKKRLRAGALSLFSLDKQYKYKGQQHTCQDTAAVQGHILQASDALGDKSLDGFVHTGGSSTAEEAEAKDLDLLRSQYGK